MATVRLHNTSIENIDEDRRDVFYEFFFFTYEEDLSKLLVGCIKK